MLSVSEAAARLHVNPGRIRQLVAAGRLPAFKVGGRWVLPDDAVAARLAAERPASRPLSPRSAWGLLQAAAGRPAPWLAPSELRRARLRSGSWPLERWASACRRRADVHRVYAHPSLLAGLAEDARLVRSGASARDAPIDLVVLDQVEGYLRAEAFDAVVDDYALGEGRTANVILRVPPVQLFVFGDEPEAPWPVVAVDLFDVGDDRSVRAAHALMERNRP
jgi:excisionase family DNA binding protein